SSRSSSPCAAGSRDTRDGGSGFERGSTNSIIERKWCQSCALTEACEHLTSRTPALHATPGSLAREVNAQSFSYDRQGRPGRQVGMQHTVHPQGLFDRGHGAVKDKRMNVSRDVTLDVCIGNKECMA